MLGNVFGPGNMEATPPPLKTSMTDKIQVRVTAYQLFTEDTATGN
jgi:hypothetical protein